MPKLVTTCPCSSQTTHAPRLMPVLLTNYPRSSPHACAPYLTPMLLASCLRLLICISGLPCSPQAQVVLLLPLRYCCSP